MSSDRLSLQSDRWKNLRDSPPACSWPPCNRYAQSAHFLLTRPVILQPAMTPSFASTPAPPTIVPPMSATRTIRNGRSSTQTPVAQGPGPEPCKFQVTVQTDGSEHTVPADSKLRLQLAKQLSAQYGGHQKVLSRYLGTPVDGKVYHQFKLKANTAPVRSVCTQHRHLFDPDGNLHCLLPSVTHFGQAAGLLHPKNLHHYPTEGKGSWHSTLTIYRNWPAHRWQHARSRSC